MVRSLLKVHRQLHRNVSGALAIKRFHVRAYSPVELSAPRCGQPLIKHVLIQSVYEAEPAYRFSIRLYVNTAILNKVTLTSEFVAPCFDRRSIITQRRRDRER